MKELIQNLIKLQALEFGELKEKNPDAMIADLRIRIPPQILGHYDRLAARGKKGITPVRDQVCSGCHMRLPIGVITTLMHGRDLQLCDTCGRYLYLPPQGQPPPPQPPAAADQPPRKTKKAKRSLHTA